MQTTKMRESAVRPFTSSSKLHTSAPNLNKEALASQTKWGADGPSFGTPCWCSKLSRRTSKHIHKRLLLVSRGVAEKQMRREVEKQQAVHFQKRLSRTELRRDGKAMWHLCEFRQNVQMRKKLWKHRLQQHRRRLCNGGWNVNSLGV